jgi:hypothetical protein
MYKKRSCVFVVALMSFIPPAMSQNASLTKAQTNAAASWSLSFAHKDWELTCDNTRTCRAAGYSVFEGTEIPASVLLTRAAGANTAVQVEIRHNPAEPIEAGDAADLRIGKTTLRRVPLQAGFKESQVAQLLPLLLENSSIEVTQGKAKSRISLEGAKAVLMKMDDAQGRVGTASAIAAKDAGKGGNPQVIVPPVAAPVVQAVRISADQKIDAALMKAAKAAVAKHECMSPDGETAVSRLSRTHLLVSRSPCWRAAYNEGNDYWVVNAVSPYAAVRVDDDSLNEWDDSSSMLRGVQKARGVGDCHSTSELVWNGASFVKTKQSHTGQCRGFPGGVWDLPIYTAKVIAAK